MEEESDVIWSDLPGVQSLIIREGALSTVKLRVWAAHMVVEPNRPGLATENP